MKVFVYGSLMRGFGNHSLLDDAKFLGTAVTHPTFTLLHLGGFPGLVESGRTAVCGELYEVPSHMLETLDQLEGHPDFYCRTPMQVRRDGEDGDWEWAEGYLLAEDWLDVGCQIIDSGDWREAKGGRACQSR